MGHSNRTSSIGLLVLAVCLAGCGDNSTEPDPSSAEGTYIRSVTFNIGDIEWTLELESATNSFTAYVTGSNPSGGETGTWEHDQTTMHFTQDESCDGLTGTYEYTLTDEGLDLAELDEPCSNRGQVLGGTWTRQ